MIKKLENQKYLSKYLASLEKSFPEVLVDTNNSNQVKTQRAKKKNSLI